MRIQTNFRRIFLENERKTNQNSSKILIYVFILSIAIFSFVMAYSLRSNKNTNITIKYNMVGEKLPAFSGNDPSGIKFSTKTCSTKIIVLCYIDKLDCFTCEETLTFFSLLYDEFSTDLNQIKFLAILNGANKFDVLRYKKLHRLKFPIIIDKSISIRRKLGIKGSPLKMIIVNNAILFIQNYSNKKKENNTKFRRVLNSLI